MQEHIGRGGERNVRGVASGGGGGGVWTGGGRDVLELNECPYGGGGGGRPAVLGVGNDGAGGLSKRLWATTSSDGWIMRYIASASCKEIFISSATKFNIV